MEKLICRHADIAIWFTEKALERARERNPELVTEAMPSSRSGASRLRRRPLRPPRIHVHWTLRLTFDHAQPGSVSPRIRSVLDGNSEARPKIRLEVYGADLDKVSRAALDAFPYRENIVLHGRLEHDPVSGLSGRDRVLRRMRTADCLLLLHGQEPFCEEYIPPNSMSTPGHAGRFWRLPGETLN